MGQYELAYRLLRYYYDRIPPRCYNTEGLGPLCVSKKGCEQILTCLRLGPFRPSLDVAHSWPRYRTIPEDFPCVGNSNRGRDGVLYNV